MSVATDSERIARAREKVREAATNGREKRRASIDHVEVRAKDDGGFTFEGHAAVFDEMSEDLGLGFGGEFREVIKRGAFKDVLDNDVRLLINHDPNLVLARTASGTLELSEDPKGLKAVADVAPTSYAADLRILLERGDVSQMSFAFVIGADGADEWHEDEDGNVTRTILRVGELLDASAVTYPAYPQTDAAARALVCGIEVVGDAGEVHEDRLGELAWRIHRGEVKATAEERGAIDAAFAKTADGVSPWMAQRALMATSQEHELRGVIQGKRCSTVMEDAPSGGPDHRLAARQRRLRLMGG